MEDGRYVNTVRIMLWKCWPKYQNHNMLLELVSYRVDFYILKPICLLQNVCISWRHCYNVSNNLGFPLTYTCFRPKEYWWHGVTSFREWQTTCKCKRPFPNKTRTRRICVFESKPSGAQSMQQDTLKEQKRCLNANINYNEVRLDWKWNISLFGVYVRFELYNNWYLYS